jgi:hypothetical protein
MLTSVSDAHNLGSETKKATGIPMFMGECAFGLTNDARSDLHVMTELSAIGQCGSVLGSHIYPTTEGPKYMWVSSSVALWAHIHLL